MNSDHDRNLGSLIPLHMWQLVEACYPASDEEALRLWHDIKPVRRGNITTWTIQDQYSLFSFGVPDDSAYFVVMRVESYVTTNVAAAPGYGLKQPIPSNAASGSARWAVSATPFPPDEENHTGVVEPHVLLDDVDELLFFKAGSLIQLIASLPANPDANARFIRTVIYGYLLGPTIADIIGAGEIETSSRFT